MAQYMYDKDGNRTVILSEEEEQKKQDESLAGVCALFAAILVFCIVWGSMDNDTPGIALKIKLFINNINYDWLRWGLEFVAWYLFYILFYMVGKLLGKGGVLIFFLIGFVFLF